MRTRRKSLGLTRAAAADKGGLSHTTWARVESGELSPRRSTRAGVARSLGLDPDWWNLLQAGAPTHTVTGEVAPAASPGTPHDTPTDPRAATVRSALEGDDRLSPSARRALWAGYLAAREG